MRKILKYFEDTHESEVTLIHGPVKAVGKARAHDDDKRYANKLTGLQIAEFRALIKFLDKRSKLKMKQVQRLRNDAQFLENSAKEDIAELEELKMVVKEYIDEKDAFYKKLKNPPERIKWNKLSEDMLSPDFKTKMQRPAIEGEVVDGETKN